ncbi:MAG: gliding motility-associated protein GldE [Sphingobacteriales bacterium 12-47-4]|nr:MAG: gliding motility-associated protein GldE [Sphingobacteriales bacterium 12-47-4]
MDPSTQGINLLFVLLLLLLALSFVISGAEVAFFSLTRKDINMLKTKQHSMAKKIILLLSESKQVYTSLLLAGTFINITIIILMSYIIQQYFPYGSLGRIDLMYFDAGFLLELLIRVTIIGVILIFFATILPKVWATQNNLRFAYGSVLIVEGIHLFLRRLSVRMVKVADNIGRNLGANRSEITSLQQLDEAIDVSANGNATVEEKNILKGIVKFGNITVKQIMRTRLEVSGIEYNTDFSTLVRRIEELHYSRLPVYKGSLDEVVGVINTKDILPHLSENPEYDWHILVRQPFFVPETKLIRDLLREFQTRKVHFAVVVDEFGGTSGIVTLEDILEEVIGDIRDEFDEDEAGFVRLEDGSYEFEGKTKITDVCRAMKLPIDTFDKVKGDSESLAGLVLELAGELPAIQDAVPTGDFLFTVLETSRNRIEKVKISIQQRTE